MQSVLDYKELGKQDQFSREKTISGGQVADDLDIGIIKHKS